MIRRLMNRLRLAAWRRKYWTPPNSERLTVLRPYRDARQAGFTLIN